MKDRRKVKRRYLLYYARIYDRESHQQIGNLVDITPSGAMILSPSAFPVGKVLRLQIELTDDIAAQPYLEVEGKVKWTQPDIEPQTYNLGIEFIQVTEEDKKIIEKIIALYGFRDNILSKQD
ncbi:MAG: PilZ domain-containing protein [Anaerolineales bacterium]|nr:PilZ domain-containing protein [Anaerolineales bacterium]MDW8228097.1 PilZ domain-containing protein [Anaerolineales bacterium]